MPGDSPPAPETAAPPRRAGAVRAVLNAVLGDYLHKQGNELATEMGFRLAHRPVVLTRESLLEAYPAATRRVAVWVHGLGCTEQVWEYPERPEKSYGTQLFEEEGLTPFYLRYNTGRPIWENGAALATLLDTLVSCYPLPMEELVLVGYSMGGLVLRSACHVASTAGLAWPSKVGRVIYLGVPHLGAPLENLGSLLTRTLRALPNPYTRLVAQLLDVRSRGIKDLGAGSLLAGGEAQAQVPALPGVPHQLIAGALGPDERHLVSLLLGDGVVQLASAGGRGAAAAPLFPDGQVRVVPGVSHLALPHHPDVYRQLREWCGAKKERP